MSSSPGAVYLAVAFLLAFKYGSFSQDAVARMANGFYVLYSRDPHLASVGFVWEPLQSISDLVFLIPNHLWQALSNRDMAGAFVSVIGMVGAVHQLRCALLEWGVRLAPRLVLTALFALDPMILYYSGNGMSEGLYLFALVRVDPLSPSMDSHQKPQLAGLCRRGPRILRSDSKRGGGRRRGGHVGRGVF